MNLRRWISTRTPIVLALVALAGLPALPGAAYEPTAKPDSTPKPTGWRVKKSVAEAALHLKVRGSLLEHLGFVATKIEVDVFGTDVVLEGRVTERAVRETAADVAESVTGVAKVDNRIVVEDPDPTAPPASKQMERAERLLADQILEGRVKSSILEAVGKAAFDIEVEATDGVVRLSGRVTDRRVRSLALDAAEKTEGVRNVHDLLANS